MDFRELMYFVAVAEEGNIMKAAARLHISQPPLTRHIQQLESDLGAQLFVRSKKGVRLTEAGTQLFEGARNMLALGTQTRERVQRAASGQLGRLDVGIFGTGVFDVIPRLLLRFREQYPGVKLVLHTMTGDEQTEALLQRRLSVGFTRYAPDRAEIASELVRKEQFVVVTPARHPLAKRSNIPLADLAPYPFLLFPKGRPNFMNHVLKLCRDAGFEPQISHEVEDATTGVALVAAGFGICLVTESARALRIAGAEFRTLAPPAPTVDLRCIYLREEVSPILSEFLEVVRTEQSAPDRK